MILAILLVTFWDEVTSNDRGIKFGHGEKKSLNHLAGFIPFIYHL